MSRFIGEYFDRSQVRHIPAAEVYARLGEPELHLLDCNLEFVFRTAHLPGAVYVGYDGLDPALLPSNRDARLVFYCGSSL